MPGVAEVCPAVSPLCQPSAARFDAWVLASGLPDRFGAAPGTIPANQYIAPDPDLIARWRPYVVGGGLKIGLNWSGEPHNPNAPHRDIPLMAFEPLGRI